MQTCQLLTLHMGCWGAHVFRCVLCLYSECCTALRLLFDCRPFVLDDEALCFEAIFPVLRLVRSCYALNLRAVALTHEQAFATPDLSTLQVATPPWCKLLRTAFDLTDCLPPAACKSSICRSRCGWVIIHINNSNFSESPSNWVSITAITPLV